MVTKNLSQFPKFEPKRSEMPTPQKLSKSLLFLALLATPAYAEAPCDFKTNDKIVYEGRLESVRLISKKVTKHVEDTNKCMVKIEGRVEGKWYPSTDSYVYGPDVSQQHACDFAENRAKKKILRQFVPETIHSEKNLKCDLTSPKKSCKVIYINASIAGEMSKQRIRMLSCEKK